MPRLAELLLGVVDADHSPAGADLLGGEEGVHARAAAQVDNALALAQVCEVEEIADSRERFDSFIGDPIEDVGGIAETLCERTPQLEVVLALRLLCNVAIHVLDLRLELVGIEGRFHGFLLAWLAGLGCGWSRAAPAPPDAERCR